MDNSSTKGYGHTCGQIFRGGGQDFSGQGGGQREGGKIQRRQGGGRQGGGELNCPPTRIYGYGEWHRMGHRYRCLPHTPLSETFPDPLGPWIPWRQNFQQSPPSPPPPIHTAPNPNVRLRRGFLRSHKVEKLARFLR